MIVKVCGMRDAENIRQIDALGNVDWMGFIFFDKSSRNVNLVPTYLPEHCRRVGVFVNATIENICQKMKDFRFDLLQLHGNESPCYCQLLRAAMDNTVNIVKMIQVASKTDLDTALPYEGVVDYFLFETKCNSYGGSGKQFDWDILHHYEGQTPFLITGGIGADDAGRVKAFHHPRFVGIDLNSRFEIAPALKDITLIDKFLKQIKQ